MYIKKVSIKSIKSLKKLTIEFKEPFVGWHVLLGDNGSGKSTILKSISLCLIGERQGYSLKQNFKNWITKGEIVSNCQIDIILDEDHDSFSNKYSGNISYILKIDKGGKLDFHYKSNKKRLKEYPSDVPEGWYSSAFGPYRRLGEKDTQQVSSYTDGNLENHITLFDPSYNLTSAIQWLMDLKFEALSTKSEEPIFEKVILFINDSNLLPNSVKIEKVDHTGVFFVDGNNKGVEVNELSDGYQSIFSLAIEILRQLSKRFSLSKIIKKTEKKSIITATGVILIDEIDIHLHPQWQSKIGSWFKENFPKIQFIVSTHSPIICQSAEGGTIWKIEHSKSSKSSHQVIGQEFKRMVYGSITDSIGTDNFGEQNIERSDKSKQMLNRLAELNIKSIRGLASSKEEEELKDLKAILPSQNQL